MTMGLPMPFLVGGVEIQERRPKYWNEPRRKRLAFVNSHNKQNEREGNWALAPRNQPQASRYHARNEQQRWDLRQSEARQRFMQHDHHDRMLQLQFEQQRLQLQGPMAPHLGHPQGQGHPFGHPQQRQIHPQQRQIHPQDPRQHHGHHGHPLDARPHRREDPDDIVAVVSESEPSSDDDANDDGSSSSGDDPPNACRRSHSHGRIKPRIIHVRPKPKEPLRLKPAKRRGSKHRGASPDSDSGSDASVVRAVKHALKHDRGRSRSKPRSSIRRTKVIYEDEPYYPSDDSFESYRSRHGRVKLRK